MSLPLAWLCFMYLCANLRNDHCEHTSTTQTQGSTMNHSDLNKLWATQQKEMRRWQESLANEAANLYKAVVTRLQPNPDTWSDFETKEPRRYVDLLDVSGKK